MVTNIYVQYSVQSVVSLKKYSWDYSLYSNHMAMTFLRSVVSFGIFVVRTIINQWLLQYALTLKLGEWPVDDGQGIYRI